MYDYEIKPFLQKVLNKLSKKDNKRYELIWKKINEIVSNPNTEHYKNLRYDMKDKKRVHIGYFVLVFEFIKEENKIIFLDFEHHDKIYKKR